MSPPLSISEQLALLPRLVQGSRTVSYSNISAWLLLVWDHLISLEQEVEYIWRGKKKLSNVIYVLLRYASLIILTYNVFSGLKPPSSDKFCTQCVVLMHMSSWPLLVINAVAEGVMAARVVVLWDKWVIAIVSATWFLGIGGTCVLLAQRIPIYAKATSLSFPGINFHECILPPEDVAQLDEFWKMWLILLGYNTILGALACAKGVSTYRRKIRRQSHPPLLLIIVRGSLDYYFVIIALNILMLLLWRYGDAFLFNAGSGMTLPVTVILSCHLILHLRQAYYGPGEGGLHVKLPLTSSMEVRSGPAITTISDRIPLRSRGDKEFHILDVFHFLSQNLNELNERNDLCYVLRNSCTKHFLIGFAIIIGASIMNAGGLNLVKLDMVRTMTLPRASRRRDFLRPLWVLGMVLYIISQLIGSTLALEYMRAEYVAPLGSSSLIFNFLFASLLVGTPVTKNDVYGTIIVVAGVVGIVLFGSINSGLESGMDLERLIGLWSRPGWLLYFILLQCLPLFLLFTGAAQLEAVLVARSNISEVPFAGQGGADSRRQGKHSEGFVGFVQRLNDHWGAAMHWTMEKIEAWSMNKNDKMLAWTLGICWACCGGGLAGECLVFAKVCVKLISGGVSHGNNGSQFAHPASIFTVIFLAITAVSQILCLNRGLRSYDSTLVVPVFYGVYTANGFLNSLIFNDEVDSYQSWALFLIFLSIVILIGGVVLLTLKKPAPAPGGNAQAKNVTAAPARHRLRNKHTGENERDENDEEIALQPRQGTEGENVWELGNASDSDDDDREDPRKDVERTPPATEPRRGYSGRNEHQGLVEEGDHSDSEDDFGEFTTSKRT